MGAGDGGAEAARDIISAGPVGPGVWAARWLLRQALKGQKNITVYAK